MSQRSSHLTPLKIEWICAQIFTQLFRRHYRYLLVILPMYLRSVFGPVRCHILRSAYCFARYLDDVLDGDIPVESKPCEYVEQIIKKIEQGASSEPDETALLGAYVFEHIDQYRSNGILPSEELHKLIEAMLFDRRRSEQQLLLSQQELDAHHLKTFQSALNVTLNICGANYQDQEVIPVARAQAHLYSLRDIEEDLENKINNIPKEVISDTDLSNESRWNFDVLSENEAFKSWIIDEYNRGCEMVSEIEHVVKNNSDRKFKAVVKPLYYGLNHLTKKLSKQHNFSSLGKGSTNGKHNGN